MADRKLFIVLPWAGNVVLVGRKLFRTWQEGFLVSYTVNSRWTGILFEEQTNKIIDMKYF